MEIFGWVKELEEKYQDIIHNVEIKIENEIETIRQKNLASLKKTTVKLEKIRCKTINVVRENLNKEVSKCFEREEILFKDLEKLFEENKGRITEEVKKRIGINF